jgi:hypothetical protein
MKQQPLRPSDSHGRLGSDELCECERLFDYRITRALDDMRDESETERLGRRERAAGERELGEERGRGDRLWPPSEGANVRRQANVNFLK